MCGIRPGGRNERSIDVNIDLPRFLPKQEPRNLVVAELFEPTWAIGSEQPLSLLRQETRRCIHVPLDDCPNSILAFLAASSQRFSNNWDQQSCCVFPEEEHSNGVCRGIGPLWPAFPLVRVSRYAKDPASRLPGGKFRDVCNEAARIHLAPQDSAINKADIFFVSLRA